MDFEEAIDRLMAHRYLSATIIQWLGEAVPGGKGIQALLRTGADEIEGKGYKNVANEIRMTLEGVEGHQPPTFTVIQGGKDRPNPGRT